MKPGQHRETARIILCKANREVFFLKTHFDPEVGLPPRWLTPGGGIDPDENIRAAAIRELFEETGLELGADALGQQIWQTNGRWDWSDGRNHHTFVDYFFIYHLSQQESDNFQLDKSGWTIDEHRDVLEHRWWQLQELKESGESVSPPGLVDFLADHL